jgi:NAD(P)-dependent dehydrogenase (short-subunit alcohol dehydrogenase family)
MTNTCKVLIIGPSQSGLGAETAISLAHGSPELLILIGRSIAKIQPTIDSIGAINASINVKFFKTDLSSLSSVRQTAQDILQDDGIHHIDAIFNNAAIMASPLARTADG